MREGAGSKVRPDGRPDAETDCERDANVSESFGTFVRCCNVGQDCAVESIEISFKKKNIGGLTLQAAHCLHSNHQ